MPHHEIVVIFYVNAVIINAVSSQICMNVVGANHWRRQLWVLGECASHWLPNF